MEERVGEFEDRLGLFFIMALTDAMMGHIEKASSPMRAYQ